MDARTSGLILRTRPLTESSLIVHWLTRDLGRLSTVAKGARRPKSPFLGKLDLFYSADLSVHLSRRSELHTLREVKVLDFRRGLRVDLGRLQQASYFAQLLEQTTEVNTPIPALFELYGATLDALSNEAPAAATVFGFELRLLGELGLTPDLTGSNLSATVREAIAELARPVGAGFAARSLTAAETGELDRFLQRFLVYHLGRLPKSRPAAVQVS